MNIKQPAKKRRSCRYLRVCCTRVRQMTFKVFLLLQKAIAFAQSVTMIPPKKLYLRGHHPHLRIAFKILRWRVLLDKIDNLISLLVKHACLVCPTTFTVKFSTSRGTLAY